MSSPDLDWHQASRTPNLKASAVLKNRDNPPSFLLPEHPQDTSALDGLPPYETSWIGSCFFTSAKAYSRSTHLSFVVPDLSCTC